MGKSELHVQQQQQIQGDRSVCQRCSMGLSRIGREFNLKCVVVLIFSFSVFLSAVFWVLPFHHPTQEPGFDAKHAIKLRATVQASFRLQKPVSMLVPHIGRLEYDIYGEIGVPYTKVAILSMHQADASTWTDAVFGFLPFPIDAPMIPVSLSVLRSSLIELFLQQSNLTLTTTFGQPSLLEILKYPGGISIIPDQSASIWQISQILFNFTLHNSIHEIKENLVELKQQLKLGLRLRPYENVFVQLTNQNGSTRDPPVTVQAAIISDLGSLLPQRLRQLAHLITGSPNNLGLNNTVFGNVNEVSLSSFLNQTILATPPAPSPAPAPEQTHYAQHPISSSPNIPPSDPPAPQSPENHPHHSSPPISISPRPSEVHKCAPHRSPTQQLSPGPSPLPPLPVASCDPTPRREKGSAKGLVSPKLASPPLSPSLPSSAMGLSKLVLLFTLFGLLTFHLLCWS